MPQRWRVGIHHWSVAGHFMKVQARTYRYALAVVMLALVVGWAGRITWQDLRQLHRNFDGMQADAFHLAEHIEASVRHLNATVQRFDLRRNPEDRDAFQKESQELQAWMGAHQTPVTTVKEGELLARLQSAFDLYVALATQLMDERVQAGGTPSPTPVQERVESEAAPVLGLCEELKIAERAAQKQFMKDSHRALGSLQQLLIVQLGLLIILVGTAVVAIYRGVIGPLRCSNSATSQSRNHASPRSPDSVASGFRPVDRPARISA